MKIPAATVASLLALNFGSPVIAQTPSQSPAPDFQSVIRDVELVNKSDNHLSISFWMPAQFWRYSLVASGKLTPAAIDDFVRSVEPYTLIAVVDGTTSGGAISYRDPAELASLVTIEDAQGNIYRPMNQADVDVRLKSVIAAMQPIVTNIIGNMGSHMQFLVFPATDRKGQIFDDPLKEGSLKVHVGDVNFRYRLPLGSFLPVVMDAKTGEHFPGNFRYSPYTGDKLVPAR